MPIEGLVLACAVVAAGTGIATFHAVHQPTGHVEVGPAAFARLRLPKKTAAKRVEPPATSIAQTPLLRGGTHDPQSLLATAKKLQAYGLDLTVVEVQMAKPFASWPDTYLDFWPARFVSVYGPGHHLDGLELHAIPSESPLREAGLADGDQLLGIDGYDLADDSLRHVDVLPARSRGSAVVEVARANHHVVLSIRWPVR